MTWRDGQMEGNAEEERSNESEHCVRAGEKMRGSKGRDEREEEIEREGHGGRGIQRDRDSKERSYEWAQWEGVSDK